MSQQVLSWTFKVILRTSSIGPAATTEARLLFDSADPAVISLEIHAQNSDQVWIFARSMMTDAIASPNLYGQGLVQLCTYKVRHLAKYLNIQVGRPSHLFIQFERLVTDQFYARTCDLVPLEAEESYYFAVIDADLDLLLRPPDPTTP